MVDDPYIRGSGRNCDKGKTMTNLSPAELNDVARLVMAAARCGPQLLDDVNDFIVGVDRRVLAEARRICQSSAQSKRKNVMTVKPKLPRALSRPGSLPLWALIGSDGKMIGLQTFEDGRLPVYSDGRHYLPVFGDEPEADLNKQYFLDSSYAIESDRVVRNRVVRDRDAA